MTLTKTLLFITNPFLHLQIGLQRLIDTKLFRTIIKKIPSLLYQRASLLHARHAQVHARMRAREGEERERERRATLYALSYVDL